MRYCRFYFFLLLVCICASCKNESVKSKNVFYWNIASGVTSLDPAFASIQPNIWMVQQLYNGLVALDDSLHVIPSIAKNWEISKDGLQYTFHLRSDVNFHDFPMFPGGKGRKVVAQDFVYSFQRLAAPATSAPGAWVFNGIVAIDDHKNLKIEAVNDSTLSIFLAKPYPPFLSLLTLKYCSVVPREAVEHFGSRFRENPVGTGPFFLKYYIEGEKLVLHPHRNYFEKDSAGNTLPYLDAAVISFIPSKQNEFLGFLRGDLSLVSGLDQSFKDELLTKNGQVKEQYRNKFEVQVNPFLNTEYLGIQLNDSLHPNSPLLNKKIRQAINYAIDREKMIRYLRNNIGEPGTKGFVPPYLLPEQNENFYSYNPEKARQLVAESGYRKSSEVSVIKLVTTAEYLDLAVFVQKELENIGLQVSIDNIDPPTLKEWKAQGRAPFFRASWIADYADAENYLSLFYSKNFSPSGPNYFHYSNRQFDELFEQALQTENVSDRQHLYRKMQEVLMDDAPVVVLYYDKVVRLISPKVKGLNVNPINLIDLKRVRMVD